MVIDTSAILAILLAEPEAERMVRAITQDPTRMIGAPTLVEASAVMLARKGPSGEIALDAFLQKLDVQVVPMSADAATFARNAYARYGKGTGSPAGLNYGDCLAYGVAMDVNEPLLFKGEDFPKTDLPAVAY
jgi:ribonuclease VapC